MIDDTNPLDDCDSLNGDPLGDSDCDADGLTNDEEDALGTDSENPDTDGDGIIDATEIDDETDPIDPCSSVGGTPPNGSACDISIESDLVTPGTNNGSFRIINIENYPQNSVKIYNRWSVLVFEAKGYDNNTNVFTRISKGHVTIRTKDELPAGVYFYIIDYTGDMGTRTKNGYLYINR